MQDDPPFSVNDIKISNYILLYGQVILVSQDSPFNSWDEFKEYVLENPKTLSFGGPNASLLAALTIFKQDNLELIIVPYASTNDSISDFLGGHIDVTTTTPANAIPLIEDGLAKPLLKMDPSNQGVLKDIPYAPDLGYDIIEFSRWIGFHPDTPEEILDYVSNAFSRMLEDPSVKALLKQLGEEPVFIPREEAQKRYNKTMELMSKAVEFVK